MPFQFNHYYMILCETKCLQVLTILPKPFDGNAMDGHEADSVRSLLLLPVLLYFILLPNHTV